MNALRNPRQRRFAAASLTGALALSAWVGALAPAQAQVDLPVDTAPVDQVVDTVTDTVNTGVDTVNKTIDDVQDTVNDTVDDVTGKLPDLPVDVPELPDIPDLPHVPGLPGLPGLPGATGPAGNSGAAADSPSSGGDRSATWSPSSDSRGGRRPAGAVRRGARGQGAELMSTAEIVALLEEVGAAQDTVARILSPFPAGGLAEYMDDGSDRADVDITLPGTVPVSAAVDGLVSSITPAEPGEIVMTIAGVDGEEYRYDGLDPAATPLVQGSVVHRGDLIGTADGVFGFTGGAGALAFLGEALDHARAEAMLYATGVRIARAIFGESIELEPAASVSLVPVPKSLVLTAAVLLTVVSLGLAFAAPGGAAAPARARRRFFAPVSASVRT